MGKNISTRDLLDKLDKEDSEDSEVDETTEDTEELESEDSEAEGEEVDLDEIDEPEDAEELETDEGEIPPDEREQSKPKQEPEEEILAPYNMGPDDRKWFGQLPADAKRWLVNKHKATEKGVQQYLAQVSQKVRANDEITSELAKHSNRLTRHNMQPGQVVGRLLAWDEALQADPIGGALQFIQSYGVQPQHLIAAVNGQPMQQQRQMADPRVDQVAQEIERLKQEREAQRAAEVESTQARWAIEKDENGLLKYPYAEDLSETMAKCVPGLRMEDPNADIPTLLTRAYSRALEYHPELKEAVTAQREGARKKAQLAAQQKRRKQAQRAAITPRSTSGGQETRSPKKKYASTRDLLDAIDAGEVETTT